MRLNPGKHAVHINLFFSLLFQDYYSILITFVCCICSSWKQQLFCFKKVWTCGWTYMLEMSVMDAAREHVSRRRDGQGFCTFSHTRFQFLHTHTDNVLTCLLNSTGALLISSLLSPLPPHILLCSSHSFLPPPLREEKIGFSLTSDCLWVMDNFVMRIIFLCVTKKTILADLDPGLFWDKRRERKKSAAPWMKLETSWCCLRMFWSGGGMSTPATLTVCSLPLSRSLSSFTWPRAEPTASIFEIQDTFPFLIFSLSLSGRVCLFKLHGDSPS